MKAYRKTSRAVFSLMAALMLLSVIFTNAPGQAYGKYQYKITISAGQQGTINGSESVMYSGLDYGDRVNFNLRDVDLKNNSKYYVKGIRPAGRDNSESYTASSFLVEKDMDYVVAYGLLADAVAYTVEYVDSAGNELAPTETYYGNVGDKPVVAFLYIEGYRPNAYNITRTLKADASENVFRFVYTRLSGPDVIREPDQEPGENPAAPERPPAANPGGTGERPNINPGGIPVVPAEEAQEQGGAGGDENDGDGDDAGGGEEEDIPDGNVPLDQPEEILDDDPVPLADKIKIFGDAELLGVPVWLELLMLLAIAGGAYGGYRAFKRRRDG